MDKLKLRAFMRKEELIIVIWLHGEYVTERGDSVVSLSIFIVVHSIRFYLLTIISSNNITMPPIKKHVSGGVENLLKQINELKPGSPIYILFSGSQNEKGESWCPDCVKSEPAINKAVENLSNEAAFIHCEVGPRDEWKTPTNQFRIHEDLRLTAVPTIIKWKTAKRLVEDECMDPELLDMLFEGDTK